jgi:hypothetical protein
MSTINVKEEEKMGYIIFFYYRIETKTKKKRVLNVVKKFIF